MSSNVSKVPKSQKTRRMSGTSCIISYIVRGVACPRACLLSRILFPTRRRTPSPPLLPSLPRRMSPIATPTHVRMPRRPRDHSLLISARVAQGALLAESRARRYNHSSSSSPSTACANIKTSRDPHDVRANIKPSRDPHDVRFDDTASIGEQISASWQGKHAAILTLCS